jgi:prolyl-tRNA synthetase
MNQLKAERTLSVVLIGLTTYHSINVNFGRDIAEPEQFYDFKVAREGDSDPESGEVYEVFKTAEVGNIFPLNTKFTKAFEFYFTDEAGQRQPVYMGSYGIGTSRVMGVIVEKFHDEKGILWPKNIAPFAVHLISLPGAEEQAQKLYSELQSRGIEVFWDDRDTTAGSKFADADLIGIPVRLVVSQKTNGQVEWKERSSAETALLSESEVLQRLK